jgi:hypothetical protein
MSYHRKSFQTEVDDNFCERSSLSGKENEPVREILRSIFNPNPDEDLATIESLLQHPLFQVRPPPSASCDLTPSRSLQSVELSLPSQKLKFQSVEKGLIKTAMTAAAERRKALRDEFMKREEKKQQEREVLASDFEDVAMADEIVNKRRNKSLRRASNPLTTPASAAASGTAGNSSKASRRLSGKRTNHNSSSPSVAMNPEDDNDSQDNPMTVTAEGVHSSIPPQYEKLLRAGLSQEQVPLLLSFSLASPNSPLSSIPTSLCSLSPLQVTHKMIADGYDPSLVGW